jgi:glycosyltransferase involved in cell wall biosynthesis
MNHKVTFVLFTFNEEKRLHWFIKNFSGHGHLLVVDNESTDNTVKLAEEAGCQVLINKNQGWVEDEITTTRIKRAIKTEWIYWGFADEMIKPMSLDHILNIINSDQFDIVKLNRKNYFYGTFCGNVLADMQVKFFKKNAIDFTANKIHGFGKITVSDQRVYSAPNEIYVGHFMDDDISSYLAKINKYTDIEEVSKENIKGSFFKGFVVAPLKIFLKNYFFQKGWRLGVPGIVIIYAQMTYSCIKAIKSYEANSLIYRKRMEEIYRDEKERYID